MDTNIDAILITDQDNVATVTREVAAGEYVRFLRDGKAVEITSSGVPKYHKIAVEAIPRGGQVRKYGEVIAMATQDIPQGAHVHTHNVTSGVQEGDAV